MSYPSFDLEKCHSFTGNVRGDNTRVCRDKAHFVTCCLLREDEVKVWLMMLSCFSELKIALFELILGSSGGTKKVPRVKYVSLSWSRVFLVSCFLQSIWRQDSTQICELWLILNLMDTRKCNSANAVCSVTVDFANSSLTCLIHGCTNKQIYQLCIELVCFSACRTYMFFCVGTRVLQSSRDLVKFKLVI